MQRSAEARDREAERRLVGDHAEREDLIAFGFPDDAIEHLEAAVRFAKQETAGHQLAIDWAAARDATTRGCRIAATANARSHCLSHR